MTPKAVQTGMDEADPDSMTVIYWTMLRQAGQQDAVLSDALKPDIILLNNAIGTAIEQEAVGEGPGAGRSEAAAAKAANWLPSHRAAASPEPPLPAGYDPDAPPGSQRNGGSCL